MADGCPRGVTSRASAPTVRAQWLGRSIAAACGKHSLPSFICFLFLKRPSDAPRSVELIGLVRGAYLLGIRFSGHAKTATALQSMSESSFVNMGSVNMNVSTYGRL